MVNYICEIKFSLRAYFNPFLQNLNSINPGTIRSANCSIIQNVRAGTGHLVLASSSKLQMVKGCYFSSELG
jgi:hypothetical protein